MSNTNTLKYEGNVYHIETETTDIRIKINALWKIWNEHVNIKDNMGRYTDEKMMVTDFKNILQAAFTIGTKFLYIARDGIGIELTELYACFYQKNFPKTSERKYYRFNLHNIPLASLTIPFFNVDQIIWPERELKMLDIFTESINYNLSNNLLNLNFSSIPNGDTKSYYTFWSLPSFERNTLEISLKSPIQISKAIIASPNFFEMKGNQILPYHIQLGSLITFTTSPSNLPEDIYKIITADWTMIAKYSSETFIEVLVYCEQTKSIFSSTLKVPLVTTGAFERASIPSYKTWLNGSKAILQGNNINELVFYCTSLNGQFIHQKKSDGPVIISWSNGLPLKTLF